MSRKYLIRRSVSQYMIRNGPDGNVDAVANQIFRVLGAVQPVNARSLRAVYDDAVSAYNTFRSMPRAPNNQMCFMNIMLGLRHTYDDHMEQAVVRIIDVLVDGITRIEKLEEFNRIRLAYTLLNIPARSRPHLRRAAKRFRPNYAE